MDEFNEILKELGVTSLAVYQGEKDKMDHWRVTLTRDGGSIETAYSAGFGHRAAKVTITSRGKETIKVLKPPTTGNVVAALFLDASCVDGETFEGFASNLGYDTDSRKALECYLACQQAGNNLRRMFRAEFAKLAAMAGDL